MRLNFVSTIPGQDQYRNADEQRVPFDTIGKLCSEAESITTFRNDLMHSSLTAVDEKTIELEKRKRDNRFSLKVQYFDISKLNKKTEQTQFVAGDLICIWMGYHTITPRVV